MLTRRAYRPRGPRKARSGRAAGHVEAGELSVHDLVLRLAEDVVLLPDFAECFDRFVEMGRRVPGRELRPDAGLPLRDDREEEADDVDPFREEVARDVLRELRVVEHDRDDRALAGLDVEAGLRQEPPPDAESARPRLRHDRAARPARAERTPKRSGVPRPVFPMKPEACESSQKAI